MDNSYNEEMFKSKINNMMIQILYAEMMQNLDPVRHFLTDKLEKEFEEKIIDRKKKKQRQMYDELNVSSTEIISVTFDENYYIVVAQMTIKYINYIIDLNGNYVSGNQKKRTKNDYTVTFKKTKAYKEFSLSRNCPNCGHNINVSLNGKCEYCDTIYNLEDYDYIVTDIKMAK